MSDSNASLALREWKSRFTAPRVLAGLAGLAVILTLVGPFGTDQTLRAGPRLAYWIVMAGATYSVGVLSGAYLSRKFAPSSAAWPRIVAVMLASGLGVTFVVYLINRLTFGSWLSATDAPWFFLNVFLISSIITALFEVFANSNAGTPADRTTPALLDRLPLDKRGALIALTVQDHYVEVTTTQGTELILMRLSDAIKETAPTAGLQTHRSFWAATDHIASVSRHKERAILTMSNGAEVPVSRSYLPALRAQNLL